jgi:hypothetical protein
MVNNNIEKHDIIKKTYNDKFKVIKGDNSQYEFSGIQKCIELLRTNNILKEYKVFLLGTDALFNHPIYYFDFINIDLLEEAANKMPESGEDSPIHSCKRLIACTLYTICQFSL